MHRDPIPDVRRIAVLRANVLGDLMFSLPALDALRLAYPFAEIVLLGRRWHRALLTGRRSPVDRVAILGDELFDGLSLAPRPPAVVEAAVRALGVTDVDLAIQLHGGGRTSNPVIRALGARVTAGLRTPDAPPLDRWLPYVYWQHEIHRGLEVVGLAGAPPVDPAPRLQVGDTDRRAAEAVLRDDGRPLAVLHPGANDGRRRWSAARFAAVGDALVVDGWQVAITGSVDERSLTASVASVMHRAALDLGGRLELPGLVGVLDRAELVVSNDTGPLHLAVAVGTPTVGIFWIGNLVNGAPAYRERHRPVIGWRLDCSVCGTDCIRGRCDHSASFVDDVTVAEVLDAIGSLRDRTTPSTGMPDTERHPAAGMEVAAGRS
jgi:ADP-heptose:LPS heptosyltransferase